LKNKSLENRRYYGVIFNNVQVNRVVIVVPGSTVLEPLMPTPYSQLVEKLKAHFSIDIEPTQAATQQFRNHMSALNGFLAFCGKTTDSNVGSEFGSHFAAKLDGYLSRLDVAPRTLKDRSIQIKVIKRVYDLSTPHATMSVSSTLAHQLRQYIADSGVAPKTLAKQAGVDPTTLYRWIAGATPRPEMYPALRRLENRLGLQRDQLVAMVKPEPAKSSTVHLPQYRVRISSGTKHHLRFSIDELPSSFMAEWKAFFDYKISSFPHLERHSKGQWRLIPKRVSTDFASYAERGEMTCPTALRVMEQLKSSLGVVLHLAPEDGGLCWTSPPNPTLALLAHPSALGCYLQWMSDRSGGLRHEGHRVFAQFCASLVRPETGYLWQQPDIFRERLPEELRPNTDVEWQKMCAASHKFLRGYIRTAKDTSRVPEEPIFEVLSLDEPFQPIFDAIERIHIDAAACPTGGVARARLKRDALLLALLISNPLRVRSLASLTWLPNNQGSIRGNSELGWRIVLTPAQLKNGGSQVGRVYNVKIADWVQPMLEEYLEEFRATLLGGASSDYLLVSSRDRGIWKNMTGRVIKLTRRYIPGSPGFGPHAFRHLVATVWLRKHPNDYLTVAELLNDSLQTVLARYAHLRRDDSFGRFEALMGPGR
jgi:integrase